MALNCYVDLSCKRDRDWAHLWPCGIAILIVRSTCLALLEACAIKIVSLRSETKRMVQMLAVALDELLRAVRNLSCTVQRCLSDVGPGIYAPARCFYWAPFAMGLKVSFFRL